jgi:hypothetical protein
MKHLKCLPIIIATIMLISGCQKKTEKSDEQKSTITEATIVETIDKLKASHPEVNADRIERGVRHTASIWWPIDGTAEEFNAFCDSNFVADEEMRASFFKKISKHIETLYGHFNWMTLKLQEPVHLKFGDILPIDEMFSAFSPAAHLEDDLYSSKIAFVVALNFPYYSLSEKENLGKNWSRNEWAQVRLGDYFTSRVPANLQQNYAKVSSDADLYISQYNINMGKLLDEEGNTLFPKNMVLLSHWGLRDELKANYSKGDSGLIKQKMIYQVMKHIIGQTIPQTVINNKQPNWAPYSNVVSEDGKTAEAKPEPDTRYLQILNNFKALKAMDAYSPLNTYIRRNFEEGMEITQPEVEALFIRFLESDVLKEVGQHISNRLGRELQPFDIWYDGFKARSNINQDVLSNKTRELYPNAEAFKKDLPNILTNLGFNNQRANEISDKISIDPARGSGHAWGAAISGMQSHLRTRIPDNGMDYKGYNIAMHELGHNVEQTISFYNVDNYMLNGVPNTAFTEALAFIFQKRDLELLGMKEKDVSAEAYRTLDLVWSSYEIMGVSLLDMRMWKWLYENPDANEKQLKETVARLATEIWNSYYAPVYGGKDEPILAIYSHMVSYPLYLSAYAYGNIIEFQLEEHLKTHDFATEVDRMYQLGKLTPNHWMQQAVGANMDIEPMLKAGKEALGAVN